jgi:hypothetical protein
MARIELPPALMRADLTLARREDYPGAVDGIPLANPAKVELNPAGG